MVPTSYAHHANAILRDIPALRGMFGSCANSKPCLRPPDFVFLFICFSTSEREGFNSAMWSWPICFLRASGSWWLRNLLSHHLHRGVGSTGLLNVAHSVGPGEAVPWTLTRPPLWCWKYWAVKLSSVIWVAYAMAFFFLHRQIKKI